MIIDPRESVIEERLKGIKKIILISGFKGGIGKSLFACVASISLKDLGKAVGILDLDVTSSSCHKILGVEEGYPQEVDGILPVDVHGMKFMSFYFFSKGMPLALRGSSISEAVKELFCITQWGNLDYLIIDMPPGFYDVALEIMRLVKDFKIVAIKTPSVLSRDVYERMIKLYKEKGYSIVEVENMSKDEGYNKIGFDEKIDFAVGNIEEIRKTKFYSEVKRIVEEL